jgi:hypothetical protein
MAYIKARNPNLDSKYEHLAADYMRHGEALGLRWDYAFFQMLLETGFLTYTGDVKPEQNNFAGLGATGRGIRGESFKDVSTGVRAHLEHVAVYSGQQFEKPIAERTRNIQEWGILTSWQKSINGPITYAQLAKQWAPGTRAYASDIKTIADRFFAGLCKEPDPEAEVVAQAGGKPSIRAGAEQEPARGAAPPASPENGGGSVSGTSKPQASGANGELQTPKASVAETAPHAGSSTVANPAAKPAAPMAFATAGALATTKPPLTVLNSPPADRAVAPPAKELPVETASVAGAAKAAGRIDSKQTAEKCRVWTASYGGTKAIIIRAVADQTVNYTVLDVNEGAERRESEAFINAYAKGGTTMGEFQTPAQALDKAFELCPEG